MRACSCASRKVSRTTLMIVAIYDGSGFLATENGARIACQFRADQEFSGVVQVVFHRILPPDFAFHLIKFRKIAVYEKAPPTTGHRFLLTNFTFSPFTHLGEPPHHPPPHRLSLKIDGQDVDPEIKPLPDYVQRVVTLWQTRAIIPTCELQISTVPDKSQEWPFDLAGRICRLLSVAAGTVIEWITAYGVNENNERTRCVHAARRTKPFCSLPVVPIREFGYDANTRMLQEFLQNGLEQSSARDRHRMNAVVAAYLDARLESDFVEARGIKTVVVLEMLKNLFSEEYSSKEWNKLMPKSLRKRISVVVKNALKQSEIPAGPADAVQEMMGQLNRPPFKRLVAYMIEQLGLVEDESVVKAIILARNSLVHTGQFLSVKDPEKAKELGFTDAAHEFLALLDTCGPNSLAGCGPCGDVHELLRLFTERVRSSLPRFNCGARARRTTRSRPFSDGAFTVSSEISRTSAVSSTLSPPKKRNSTTLAFRGSIRARELSASSSASSSTPRARLPSRASSRDTCNPGPRLAVRACGRGPPEFCGSSVNTARRSGPGCCI